MTRQTRPQPANFRICGGPAWANALVVFVVVAVLTAALVTGLGWVLGDQPSTHVLSRTEIELLGGRGLVLAVRAPVTTDQVEALITANKRGHVSVAVLSYAPQSNSGAGAAIARWEWSRGMASVREVELAPQSVQAGADRPRDRR